MREGFVHPVVLTSAAKELLDSFYGPEGSDFETIRDYPSVSIKTKILFLKKAITENEEAFLVLLDKLYLRGKEEAQERAQINFLSVLKRINTLAWNGDVRFQHTEGWGAIDKPIINHLFQSVLSEEDLNTIKENTVAIFDVEVQGMILLLQNIVEFFEDEDFEEGLGLRNPYWRTKVSLLPERFHYKLKKDDVIIEIMSVFPQFFDCAAEWKINLSDSVIKIIFHMIRDQKVNPHDALFEIKDLNEYQVDALVKHYFRGLRKVHLKSFSLFTQTHEEALDILLADKKLNLRYILSSLRGRGAVEVYSLCENYKDALKISPRTFYLCVSSGDDALSGDLKRFASLNGSVFGFMNQENLPERAANLQYSDLYKLSLTDDTVDTLNYLLNKTNYPVNQIVSCVGFLDQANFIAGARVFSGALEFSAGREFPLTYRRSVFNRLCALEILKRSEWVLDMFTEISEKILAIAPSSLKLKTLMKYSGLGMHVGCFDGYVMRDFLKDDALLIHEVAKHIDKLMGAQLTFLSFVEKIPLLTADQVSVVVSNVSCLENESNKILYLCLAVLFQKPVDDSLIIASVLSAVDAESWVRALAALENPKMIDAFYPQLLKSSFKLRDKKHQIIFLMNKFIAEHEATSEKNGERLSFLKMIIDAHNLMEIKELLGNKLEERCRAGKQKAGFFSSKNYTDCLAECLEIVGPAM